ncbi:MAG: hypothetical protein FJX59_06655 [Alphaproteobacteria bacterium]|nr:hypothetical protein [Alphaproteobacteria bacterium]
MISKVIACLIAITSPALAEEPIMAVFGGAITRDKAEAENVVGAAGTLEFKSVKAKKVFVAGGVVKISDATVRELVATGGNVTIEALDIGSVELAGGNVSISGQYSDDVDLAGGNVKILSGSTVAGDLSVESGNAEFDVSVIGDTRFDGERLSLAGEFGGDVRVHAKSLRIAPGTVFKSDLDVRNIDGFVLPEGVTVAGDLRRSDGSFKSEGVKIAVDLDNDEIEKQVNEKVQTAVERAAREQDQGSDDAGLIWPKPLGMGEWFTILATLAACGALALAFAPRFVAGAAQRLSQQPLESLGVGLGSMILVPLALVLVGVTVIGIPLAVLGFAAYVIGIGLGLIALCLWGGLYVRTIAQQPGDETRVPRLVGWTLMGFLVLAMIGAIPFIGRWIQILAVMAGAGAVLATAWAAPSPRRRPSPRLSRHQAEPDGSERRDAAALREAGRALAAVRLAELWSAAARRLDGAATSLVATMDRAGGRMNLAGLANHRAPDARLRAD